MSEAVDRELMIEAQSLSKFYGSFVAIRNVSFTVRRGEVAAFLGPNGAGKTTTMKILTGFLAPSEGSARLAGRDVFANRVEVVSKVGYLPENGPLYPEMTPVSLLRFLGEARGMRNPLLKSRIDSMISQCALEPVLHKSIYKLSRGYRQRVGMAQALLHDPDILILDEPTSGLDPNQIREVRRLIRLLGQDKTILLSTHILQEVEAVAEHILLIHEGQIVFDGTLAGMMEGHRSLEAAFYKLTGHDDELPPEDTTTPEAVATASAQVEEVQ